MVSVTENIKEGSWLCWLIKKRHKQRLMRGKESDGSLGETDGGVTMRVDDSDYGK
jgi:ribosomal protein L15E